MISVREFLQFMYQYIQTKSETILTIFLRLQIFEILEFQYIHSYSIINVFFFQFRIKRYQINLNDRVFLCVVEKL